MRPRILTPVLLVHGIASRGEWQDDLQQTLKLFFEPVVVRYKQFRGPFGGLLVICEPWLIACSALLGVVLSVWGLPTWDAVAIASAFALLAFLPPGVKPRRRAALAKYRAKAGSVLHRRPHVIAHSFGTYLTARLLESMNGIELSHIVLCGCVLPRNYSWLSHISGGRVAAVRNDYTRADWVGWGAKLAGRLHSNLGNAGTHGSAPTLREVHRLDAPNEACSACTKTLGTIHDVDCSDLGHSEALLIPSHLRSWWLPFFWGLDSGEHHEFLRLCERWVHARNGHNWTDIAAIEVGLATRRWGWCHRETVMTHLRRALQDHGKPTDRGTVMETFDKLAHRMRSAAAADLSTRDSLFLEPDYAVNAICRSR